MSTLTYHMTQVAVCVTAEGLFHKHAHTHVHVYVFVRVCILEVMQPLTPHFQFDQSINTVNADITKVMTVIVLDIF